jgi:hypothetical protein
MTFKTMLTVVLERLPDYRLESDAAVRYEDIGTINGYKHLPARFTPGRRFGPSLEAIMARWEAVLYDDSPVS